MTGIASMGGISRQLAYAPDGQVSSDTVGTNTFAVPQVVVVRANAYTADIPVGAAFAELAPTAANPLIIRGGIDRRAALTGRVGVPFRSDHGKYRMSKGLGASEGAEMVLRRSFWASNGVLTLKP